MGAAPVTRNALTTLTMYDTTREFPELFPEVKPSELPTLRHIMEIMQHRIDLIPASHWSPRFPSTYNLFKDQITQKINTELETGTVEPSRSRNAIAMFTEQKSDKPHEARFLLHCITRNLVTYQDKTAMPSMAQIMDLVGSRPFRCKLDLIHGYYNIRIDPESVKDSTFFCHMGKFDSRVMQQGDCNAPATMMTVVNSLFRNMTDVMIYLDNILIANHTYEEQIHNIKAVMKIGKNNTLWFLRNKCRFMPTRMQILANILTDKSLDADPHTIANI